MMMNPDASPRPHQHLLFVLLQVRPARAGVLQLQRLLLQHQLLHQLLWCIWQHQEQRCDQGVSGYLSKADEKVAVYVPAPP